jgi:hypothetical protein
MNGGRVSVFTILIIVFYGQQWRTVESSHPKERRITITKKNVFIHQKEKKNWKITFYFFLKYPLIFIFASKI